MASGILVTREASFVMMCVVALSELSPETLSDPAELNRAVKSSIESRGLWGTYRWLEDVSDTDPVMRGYQEIVRCTIVREFLSSDNLSSVVPRISPEFLSNFDQFDLTVQEGYLMSLVDGRSNIERIIKLSPFDGFTTMFTLARLKHQNAISLPS